MKYLLLPVCFIAATALAGEVPELNIDQNRVTVSGVSSGAQMAHQLHIAYSDLFSGAGIVSGGPYNCAENSMITALKRCTKNTDEPLPVAELAAGIRTSAQSGALADVGNLSDDRVWLFHGTNDITVSALVHNAVGELYAEFIPAGQIRRVDDVPAGHVFPTNGRGHGCTEMKPPFVGDCGYDAAGELLKQLYPGLSAPESRAKTELLQVTLPGANEAELMETAYLFIPPGCSGGDKACSLHLVLHGCAQSAESVGTEFIEQSGYLDWAEANDIVLAFPQVEKSLLAPLNPHGCWDWWGYTGDQYAMRNGKQMVVLVEWINSLQK